MRKNEYKSLEEFTSQYVGEWAPSEGHWLGLDFIYDEKEYRFHTGYMFVGEKDSLFSLYEKKEIPELDGKQYKLLSQYDTMDEVLESKVIGERPFKEIIMDDNTELIGQD